MKYYAHHIGDFDKATRHLTRIERSVYRDLIDMYYDTEQQLSLDVAALCRRIIARTNEESTAVEQVLNEFFTKTPTGWYHDRCEEEIEAYRASNSQKSAAGKASAAKRAAKRHQAMNGNSTTVGTTVERTSNGTPTNQEPVTSNQEPNTVTYVTGGDAARSPDQMTKDELWASGKSLLSQSGIPAKQCGSIVGKLVKDHGDAVVIEAVRAAVVARPADPLEYLKATCQRLAGVRHLVNKQEALEQRNRAVAEAWLAKQENHFEDV